MPARLTRRDRNLLVATGAIALVAIVIAAALARSEQTDVPTTYSSDSGGARAAYLLLRDAGYAVTRWERAPVDLKEQAAATLIFAEPESAPTAADREAVKDFLHRGGRVVATGSSPALLLPDSRIAADPRAAVTFTRVTASAPSPITRAAPAISISPEAHWEADAPVAVLYADDKARVVKYRVGRGEVIWWASSTPLTNAGITEPGNLEFFLACLDDRRRPILWDEYFHGHRGGPIGALAASSPFRLILVPLGVAIVAVLLTHTRRSGPIVPLEQENRLSPLEFVRTLGMLYENAGAASVSVDVAYARFRYRLTRRLGVSSAVPVEDLERAARARFHVNDSRLGDLLRECESARLDRRLAVPRALRLTQALAEQSAELGLS
jgi:hypothetical protein